MGWSDEQIERRLRNGTWQALRRGWFTESREMDPDMRWRAEVLAAIGAHERPLILSHAHAARAFRWPRPLDGWGPMSFTAAEPPARRRRDTWIAVCRLDEVETLPMGAVRVTTAVRTVVDCARRLPPVDGLAIADAALHRADVTPSQLLASLRTARGRPGIDRARQVLALADGRRETPFESWSAWAFWVQGLPPPGWQATVLDDEGVFLGRADAWWKEGVAGEADGRAKYRLASLERTGEVNVEGLAGALDDERRRERELRRAGVVIVRWEPRDALQPDRQRRLAAQLRRELDDARSHPRFTGKILWL
jgi:hypothetical protein